MKNNKFQITVYGLLALLVCSPIDIFAAANDKNLVDAKILDNIEEDGFNVKGQVVDADGYPLPGVNVLVKGTNIGVITDIDGNYTLEAPYSNASIVFSYVGFHPEERKINNRSIINITLLEDSKALEEVVVVGYATQKKLLLQVQYLQ